MGSFHRQLILVFLGAAFGGVTFGQSWLLLDKDIYDLADRSMIRKADSNFHTSVKPYFVDENDPSLRRVNGVLSSWNNQELARQTSFLKNDSIERGLWGKLYRDPGHFSALNTEALKLRVDPVLSFSGALSNQSEPVFLNTRGAVIRGVIDDKISFYTLATDNQMRVPTYVREAIDLYGGIPHENFWKDFAKNDDGTKNGAYDFFTARGAVSGQLSKSIQLTMGYDKHFVGDGYRSLILSDYGGAYSFAKINTKAWRIQYTNLFAKLTDEINFAGTAPAGAGLYNSKYLTFHHLSVNIRDNLNVGLFESIIFARQDTLGNTYGFDYNYLNPIIFYRAVEQNVGSQDNALLGLNIKYEPKDNLRLYGQFVLDEFNFSEVVARDGWWANKFAWQLGAKYVDGFGLEGLDLQLEWNRARPHMYAHTYTENSYSHYNQPLAHPLGANFDEILILARYQPVNRVVLTSKLFLINKGMDPSGLNYGGNVLLSNRTRTYTYGNVIGQGELNKIIIYELNGAYSFGSGLIAEITWFKRSQENTTSGVLEKADFLSVGLRMNVQRRRHDF